MLVARGERAGRQHKTGRTETSEYLWAIAAKNYQKLFAVPSSDYRIKAITAVIFNYQTQQPPFAKEATNSSDHDLYKTGLHAVQRDCQSIR